MADVGVIYIARAGNGLAPFQRFLDSYAAHRGGLAHELVVVFKGFVPGPELEAHERLLKPFAPRKLFLSDQGYVLRAYYAAVQSCPYRYFCFLISFSTLLDADWLAKLHEPLARSRAGLTGSTASYESLYTNIRREADGPDLVPRVRRWLRPVRLAMSRLWFAPFPNPHLRTTGCMIPREVFQRLRLLGAHTKMGALRFESGRASLTRQAEQHGLAAAVVGRDGRAYAPEEWPDSGTFRQGWQENLLIADNRTEQYAQAGPELRRHLSQLAWGARARPA